MEVAWMIYASMRDNPHSPSEEERDAFEVGWLMAEAHTKYNPCATDLSQYDNVIDISQYRT